MPRRRRQSAKDVEENKPPPPPPRPAPKVDPSDLFDRQMLFNLQPRKTPMQITYNDQLEFMTQVTRLHSKAWDAYLYSDVRLMDDLTTDVMQLREYFRCQICGDLVSDNALLPMDKNLRHGTICRECLVNNRCRCIHKGCKLTLIGFYDDPVFSLMVKTYKKFCTIFLFSAKCYKMLERKVRRDPGFDPMQLVVLLREGAFTGKRCLKKSIILTDPVSGEFEEPPKPELVLRNGVREANLRPNAELEITPRSGIVPKRSPTPCPSPLRKISHLSPSKKRSAPVIKLPPAKKWPEAAQAFAYNATTSASMTNPCMEANVYLGRNGYFTLGPVAGTSTGGSTFTKKTNVNSSANVISSPSKATSRSLQKDKAPEMTPPLPKKHKSPTKKDDQTKLANKGCRCGIAAANPGKLTCCGQRCPCYVEGKGCFDCKCKGCRNPHLPGGKKLLQGINAVIDTRTNETVPLHIPYITTQFYSNSGGQLVQPVFPLAASVASFNSYGIPVISVSPIMQQPPQ